MLKIQSFYKVLSRLSKKEKAILYFAVFLGLLLMLDRLVIYPVSSRMKTLDSQIRDSESLIRKSLRILGQKERILNEINRYNSFLGGLKSEEEEAVSLLKEIETEANKTSLYLVDLKPVGLKGSGTSKKYVITLNCEAQMGQLVNFMYNIENSKKLLLIEKYQILQKTKGSSIISCSMTVSQIVKP